MVYWQEQEEETYTAESSEMDWTGSYDKEEISFGNDAMDWSPCTQDDQVPAESEPMDWTSSNEQGEICHSDNDLIQSDLIQQMSRLSLRSYEEENMSHFLMDWSPCSEDEQMTIRDVEPMDWARQ